MRKIDLLKLVVASFITGDRMMYLAAVGELLNIPQDIWEAHTEGL